MAGLAVANDKRIDKAGDLVPFDAVVRAKRQAALCKPRRF